MYLCKLHNFLDTLLQSYSHVLIHTGLTNHYYYFWVLFIQSILIQFKLQQ